MDDIKTEFWDLVRDTMIIVFHSSYEIAQTEISDLRSRIGSESIYHSEPLDVAADLVGILDSNYSEENIKEYAELLEQKGW